MSRKIGFSRNLVLKLHNKLGLSYHCTRKVPETFANSFGTSKCTKKRKIWIQNQKFHNGTRKVFQSYCSNIKKIDLIEYRRKKTLRKTVKIFS